MKITIDTEEKTIYANGDLINLYSKTAYELISDIWTKIGWNAKVPYTFSWLGFPILQIPEDMVRMQEVICTLRPDVIVETGVAHGGSLIYYASICRMLGHGRIIGVEKGLRCRKELESSDFSDLITLIEGDSTAPDVVDQVYELSEGEKVLVILDSCHSKKHVRNELDAYCGLIDSGFYIVATDGNMKDLADVPRGVPSWSWDNPQEAAIEFVKRHPDFIIEQPSWPFNESDLDKNVTYWPNAWIKKI